MSIAVPAAYIEFDMQRRFFSCVCVLCTYMRIYGYICSLHLHDGLARQGLSNLVWASAVLDSKIQAGLSGPPLLQQQQ